MSNLTTRLPFAALFVGLAIYSIFFAPEWLFFSVAVVLVSFALYEYSRLVEAKGLAFGMNVAKYKLDKE